MGQIYVVPLKAYNAGKGSGQWVEVDDFEDGIWDEIAKVLKASPVKSEEEWAVHDYEDFPNMGEYPNVADMAYVAGALEDFPVEVVEASMEYVSDMDELKEWIEEHYAGEWKDEEDYAYNYIEDSGMMDDVPDMIKNYFDFERFGRDIFINDMFSVPAAGGGIHAFYNY